jgi:hypothetical protein
VSSYQTTYKTTKFTTNTSNNTTKQPEDNLHPSSQPSNRPTNFPVAISAYNHRYSTQPITQHSLNIPVMAHFITADVPFSIPFIVNYREHIVSQQ